MIIALKGPSQCGKSTLAGLLEKELQSRGFNVKRTAFSDFVRGEIIEALKAMEDGDWDTHPSDIFDILNSRCDEPEAANWKWLQARPAAADSRKLQQYWGQDYRRAQDPLYWIKKSFVANAEFILGSGNNILIEESCRQENEGHYVQALGGVVLDLKPLPSPTASEEAAMSHSVEQAAMSWKGDRLINMGSVLPMGELAQVIWTHDSVDDCLRFMGLPIAIHAPVLPSKR